MLMYCFAHCACVQRDEHMDDVSLHIYTLTNIHTYTHRYIKFAICYFCSLRFTLNDLLSDDYNWNDSDLDYLTSTTYYSDSGSGSYNRSYSGGGSGSSSIPPPAK